MPEIKTIHGFFPSNPPVQLSCSDNGLIVSLPSGSSDGLVISFPQGTVVEIPPHVVGSDGCVPQIEFPTGTNAPVDLSGQGISMNFDSVGQIEFPGRRKIKVTGNIRVTSKSTGETR